MPSQLKNSNFIKSDNNENLCFSLYKDHFNLYQTYLENIGRKKEVKYHLSRAWEFFQNYLMINFLMQLTSNEEMKNFSFQNPEIKEKSTFKKIKKGFLLTNFLLLSKLYEESSFLLMIEMEILLLVYFGYYYLEDDYETAGSYFNGLLKKIENVGIQNKLSDILADIYLILGNLQSNKGNLCEAENLFNKSLKINLLLYDENSSSIASCYNNLGGINEKIGNLQKAEENYLKSLKITENVFGNNNEMEALLKNNLGHLYKTMGDFLKSEDCLKEAFKIYKFLYGENHYDVAMCCLNLGNLSERKGDFQKANEFYHKTLKIFLVLYGENHPYVANCYNHIGSFKESLGDLIDADKFYKKSLKVNLSLFGENHSDVADCYSNLALLHATHQYKDKKSISLMNKTLQIYLNIYGENNFSTANCYVNLGGVYREFNCYKKAEHFYNKSLQISLTIFPENHPFVAKIYHNLGGLLHLNVMMADKLNKKSLNINLFNSRENLEISDCYNNLGNTSFFMGKINQAKMFLKKSLKIKLKFLDENHPDVELIKESLETIEEMEQNPEIIQLLLKKIKG